MPGRLDSPHRPGHLALGVDDEGRALDALVRLAVALLLLPDAVGLGGLVVGIGEKRERELVLRLEPLVGGLGVGADAQDLDPLLAEAVVGVAELARLGRAAGGVVARIEVEDDRLPAEGGERDGRALVVLQLEIGSGRAFFGSVAFSKSAFNFSISRGMVRISCFTRGMPGCSIFKRVASDEMISTPAGQELG